VARPTLVARLMTKPDGHDQEVLGSGWARAQYRIRNAMVGTSGNYTLPRISDRPSGCVDNWAATSTINAPTGRYEHTAVWTGSEMIVWGGEFPASNTGGRYNPSTDSWTATSTTNRPTARVDHTAVWTDSEMIVWGGGTLSDVFDTGGRYCAQSGAPSPTPTPTGTATATTTSTPTATPSGTPRATPTPRARPTPVPRP
jgi:hypothetical protein